MAGVPPVSFQIETPNFLIRPMLRGDACPALESWTDDETSAAMLNTRRRQWTIAEQVAYFAKFEGRQTRFLLGVFPKREREPIGVFIAKLRPGDATMLITHLIGNRDWRARGASREASIGIFDFFFNKLDYKKAKANVRPDNKAMLWLLLNAGWHKEAHLTQHLRLAGSGERSDLIVMGILAEEWRANRDWAKTVRGRARP